SVKFAEREAAAKALQAIGPLAVEALRKVAAQSKDLEVRRRAMELVDGIENSLGQLVIDYQAYGLPLPAKDAKLVRYQAGGGGLTISTVNGVTTKTQHPVAYSIGFLIRPGPNKARPTILAGTFESEARPKAKITVLEPEHASAHDIAGWVRESWRPLAL